MRRVSRADLEARRILALYRRLVLLGRARVPLAEGRLIVGPDCAFHLYFRTAAVRPSPRPGRASRKPRRKGPAAAR